MSKPQIRIASIGNVDSAKSTTISCIANRILDDGRGMARSKIMKHKHEIESGRTSSISNYYVETPEKIIGFCDLAGHEKYLKTTISGLSHCIDYSMVTIGADRGIVSGGGVNMTKEHMGLSISLNIPTMIVITKMDIAQEHKLQTIISKLKSIYALPIAGKKTLFFVENSETLEYAMNNFNQDSNIVPVFQTSNTTGQNLDLLREFIYGLKPVINWVENVDKPSKFVIEERYHIDGIGIVLSGINRGGVIRKDDHLHLGPIKGNFYEVVVKSIHNNFKTNVNELECGHGGCIAIKIVGASKKDFVNIRDIRRGVMCMREPKASMRFEADVTILHHPSTIQTSYQPIIHSGTVRQAAKIISMDKELVRTGDKARVVFEFMYHPEYLEDNSALVFREGRTKGIGKIVNIL
jgi:GTPase